LLRPVEKEFDSFIDFIEIDVKVAGQRTLSELGAPMNTDLRCSEV